jgi:hypothetical protein
MTRSQRSDKWRATHKSRAGKPLAEDRVSVNSVDPGDDRVQQVLGSAHRASFLLRLGAELTMAARACYIGTGHTVEESQAALRCLNELQIVVGKVTAAAVTDEPSPYPDDAHDSPGREGRRRWMP